MTAQKLKQKFRKRLEVGRKGLRRLRRKANWQGSTWLFVPKFPDDPSFVLSPDFLNSVKWIRVV